MRTDDSLGKDVQTDSSWTDSRFGGLEDPIDQSFSGSERNKLYYNVPATEGRTFADLSTISGLDSISDGRVFALWDFNRDGRSDVALSNSNSPSLNLFQNQIETEHHFVAVKFVGGMTENPSEKRLTARDGFGAVVTFKLADGMTIKREFRCGEGFAGQNSNTILVGIATADAVAEVSVRWPSGITDSIQQLESGTLLTLIENGEDDVPRHATEPYRPDSNK